MKPKSIFILTILGLFPFGLISQTESSRNSNNAFFIDSGKSWILGDSDYTYSVMPFRGSFSETLPRGYTIPNTFNDQHVQFSGDRFNVFRFGYTRWLTNKWGLVLSFSRADIKYSGVQKPFLVDYTYEVFSYYDNSRSERYEKSELSNPRNPMIKYERQNYSISLLREFTVNRVQIHVLAGLNYNSLRDGEMKDLYFYSNQLGSRNIRFQSYGFLEAELKESSSFGISLEGRLIYPINEVFSFYVSSSLYHNESKSFELQLTGYEEELFDYYDLNGDYSYSSSHWYIRDFADLQHRSELKSFKPSQITASVSMGINFGF